MCTYTLQINTQTSKKLSKDAKKEQRRVFRELHAAITEGAPPSQELALQNGALAATTWAEVCMCITAITANIIISNIADTFSSTVTKTTVVVPTCAVCYIVSSGTLYSVYSMPSCSTYRQTNLFVAHIA
jgi:hypothetical protein